MGEGWPVPQGLLGSVSQGALLWVSMAVQGRAAQEAVALFSCYQLRVLPFQIASPLLVDGQLSDTGH